MITDKGKEDHSATTVENLVTTRRNQQIRIQIPFCKIHDKPTDWKPTHPSNDRESHSNLASVDENSTTMEPSPFSKAQMELLQKMFNQSQQSHVTSVIGFRSLAQKGNF